MLRCCFNFQGTQRYRLMQQHKVSKLHASATLADPSASGNSASGNSKCHLVGVGLLCRSQPVRVSYFPPSGTGGQDACLALPISKTGQGGSDLNHGQGESFAVGGLDDHLLLLIRHRLHEGERRK